MRAAPFVLPRAASTRTWLRSLAESVGGAFPAFVAETRRLQLAMFDTIFGIPLHPLVVHATVVVVPLAALTSVLAVAWPRFRRWFGWGSPVVAALALALDPLSTQSGDSLEHAL